MSTEACAWLEKARLASTSQARAKYATQGLALPGLASETQTLLLRQLYLSHMESERFDEALVAAEHMVFVSDMQDVARQDAARACMGQGRYEAALEHLRMAGRNAPASRRAFHAWTVGCVLYALERYGEAVGAFSRAARWGATAKPLFLAQKALARHHSGDGSVHLARYRQKLEEAPCSQGYGQFVLGELCALLGESKNARAYLDRFVKKSESGRRALAVGLSLELQRAKSLQNSLAGRG